MASPRAASELIDVHSHIYPEPYLELLETRQEIPRVVNRDGKREFLIFPEESHADVGGREMGAEFTDLDSKLAFMDRFGIGRSIVSLGNPWLDPFPGRAGDEAAAVVNESMSRLEGESGGRVSAMGVLPSSSVDAVLDALQGIVSTPGLHGVVTGPRIAGMDFDDGRLDPVWRELNDHGLPLFVHPQDGVALERLAGYRHTLPVGVGFPMETTVALTRLVFGGVLERFPDLELLVAHGGGCVPFLAGRLDAAWRSDEEVKRRLPRPPSSYFEKLHLDALVYYGPAFRAAHGLVGSQRLHFGTDHPFSVSDPAANLRTIDTELPSGAEQALVRGAGAAQLFGMQPPNQGGKGASFS